MSIFLILGPFSARCALDAIESRVALCETRGLSGSDAMGWKLVMAAAAAAALSMGADPAPAPKPAPQPPQYYLSGATVPDTLKILPPAPQKGDIRYEADRQMFLGTRKLEGSPRWALALNDDNGGLYMKDLSCALGAEITRENAPKFMTLFSRVTRESARATNVPKDALKRQRPFLIDKGATCIDQAGGIKDSFDYPSGHVTFSWTLGLILAELAPDRATDVLVRARAFG